MFVLFIAIDAGTNVYTIYRELTVKTTVC